MRITILGCGGSGGVPMIGGVWGDCDPRNPKNNRTRASVFIEADQISLLIDTSPDIRTQFLRENITHIDAVLYTHDHADHSHGIDDLRAMNWYMKTPIDIYGSDECLKSIMGKFEYIFRMRTATTDSAFKPALIPHIINGPLQFPPLTVIPFEQEHGNQKTLGYRIGNFAYSTDCNNLSDEAFKLLQGVNVWVVDCARRNLHPTVNTHAYLPQTLTWIDRVKPKMAYLTHMGTDMDYETLCNELPAHIRPAFDGLTIEIPG